MDTECAVKQDILASETVSFPVCINALKKTSGSVFKLDTSAGSFFLRTDYLETSDFACFEQYSLLNREQFEDVVQAGLAYAAERTAVAYLIRAEQSAFLLRRKLTAKKHSTYSIEKALKYLKENEWLSDERYAAAFLRNRMIIRSEGRKRLTMELTARGINRKTAETACADFFKDNVESVLLERALSKCLRLGKSQEKSIKTLLALGFEWPEIKEAIKSLF